MITPDSLPPSSALKDERDDFFLATPELTQRLDFLQNLIQSRGFLLILTGENGSGKKTLLKRLFSSADPKWKICLIPASELSSEDAIQPATALLKRLLPEYEPRTATEAPPSDKDVLFDHVKTLHDDNEILLIVVDGNEILSPEALQLFVELSSEDTGLNARIILVCKPEGMRRIRELTTAPGGGEVTHTIDIPPFTEEQVGDYLHLRWNETDSVGDDPFTDGVIRSIYHASKGLPTNIDRLAERFLKNRRSVPIRGGRARGIRRRLGNSPLAALTQRGKLMALVGGIATVIVLLLIINHDPHQEAPKTVTLPVPIANTPTTWETEPGTIAALSDDDQPSAITPRRTTLPSLELTPEVFSARKPIPQEPIVLDEEPGIGSIPQHQALSSSVTPRDRAPIASLKSDLPEWEDDVETRTRQRKLPESPDRTTSTPTTVTATAAIKPPSMTASRKIDYHREEKKSPIDTIEPPKTRDTFREPPSVKKISKPAPVKKPSTRKRNAARTIAWLRQQDSSHYTIQLLGTSSKERMMEFLNKHQLGSQAAWFKTQRQGKEWFVIVYGIFPTRKSAATEIKLLPQTLRTLGPWPRNVGKVLLDAG